VARYHGTAAGDNDARALGVSPDGTTVFVTGDSAGYKGHSDYATLAYDASTGDQLWVARYDGPVHADDRISALAVSPDGAKVFVTGGSYTGLTAGWDYATVAYDTSTGDQLWLARYNGPASKGDLATALAVSPDGTRVFVTGFSYRATSDSDYATVAYRA
jgi:outer membrane protein assembly factor BamB